MNRADRRARQTQSRRAKTTRAEAWRAQPGEVALTIDMAELTPTTVTIQATKLADILAGFDRLMAGKTYAETARVFSAAFRHLKSGRDEAESVCLLGFWLVFSHPAGGVAAAEAASEMMIRDEPVHVTLHVSAAGGLTIALSDRFADLDRVAARAEAANMGVAVFDPTADWVRGTQQ